MIDRRHQDRIHQTRDGERRQLASQNQMHCGAEGGAPHEIGDVVSAHRDSVGLDARYRGIPHGILVGFTH